MKKIIFAAIAIFIFSYFMWQLGRWINYNLLYKDMVIETIQENVKEGCLKQ